MRVKLIFFYGFGNAGQMAMRGRTAGHDSQIGNVSRMMLAYAICLARSIDGLQLFIAPDLFWSRLA